MILLMDNMSNDFINETGAWPEAYMLHDRSGRCLKKTSFIQNGVGQLEEIKGKMEKKLQ